MKVINGEIVIHRSPTKMIACFLFCVVPALWLYSQMDRAWVLAKPEGIKWLWAMIAFLAVGAIGSMYQLTRTNLPEITIGNKSLHLSGGFGKREIPWSVIRDVRLMTSGRFQSVVLEIGKEDLDALARGLFDKFIFSDNKRQYRVWCITVTAAGLSISHLELETLLLRAWNNSKLA